MNSKKYQLLIWSSALNFLQTKYGCSKLQVCPPVRSFRHQEESDASKSSLNDAQKVADLADTGGKLEHNVHKLAGLV